MPQCLCYLANHRVLNKIMKKYKWNVEVLKELEPEYNLKNNFRENNYNLISKICYGVNINHGTDSIQILLRKLSNNEFLLYDEIMSTMIHELTHNNIPGAWRKF